MVSRSSMIVYFKGKEVLATLKKLDVNVSYVSSKLNYAVIYVDSDKVKSIKGSLGQVKGFISLEPSHLDMETYNF